jgi:hypothetical protein
MITLPRSTRSDPLDQGGWWPLGTPEGRSAVVRCPTCGECATLTDHTIAADGTVSSSLQCPHDGCTFHDHVRLEGWAAP